MKMHQELLLTLAFVFTTFALAAALTKPEAEVELFVETELILDLSRSSDDQLWIVKTDPNHILYISFLEIDDDTVAAQYLASSLNILDGTKSDSRMIIFPPDNPSVSSCHLYWSPSSSRFLLRLSRQLNELILDLSDSPSNEWIIETDHNRIIYFSFLANEDVDLQQISPFLTATNKIPSTLSITFPHSTGISRGYPNFNQPVVIKTT